MPRESTIRILRSDTAAAVPSLTAGEIAVNIPDQRLFVGNSTGGVIPFHGNGVTGINGITGGVSITSGSGITITQTGKQITVASSITQYTAPLATSSVTGVASFRAADFDVSITGSVSLTGTVARTNTAQSFSGLQTFTNGISGAGATFAGMVSVVDFLARTVGGDEGGELKLGLPATNTTLNGTNVTIDVYQNKLRIFENGGTNRGYYMDLSTASNGVGSQLATSTPYTPPLATSSVTGVASFRAADFDVSTTGSVSLTGTVARTNTSQTFTGLQVFSSGLSSNGITGTILTPSQTNITAVGTLTSLTTSGLLSTQALNVVAGATFGSDIYAPNMVTGVNGITGAVSITNGSGITITQSGKQITVASSITQYTAPLATSSITGVASFRAADFDVSITGSVSLTANVARTNIANTFTALQSFTAGLSAAGGLTFGSDLSVNGNINATTKSFVIAHPTKPGMTLRYGSLEGPENGVYVRGMLQDCDTIELPEYWRNLVDEDTITVNLTPIGSSNSHFVKSIGNNQVIVGSRSKKINCFYIVFGERKDVPKLTVEY